MSVFNNKKELVDKILHTRNNKRTAVSIYYGTHLIWESIKSCFGKGYWNNDKPWNNDDCWLN